MNASFSDDSQWNRTDMDESSWSFSSLEGERYALKADGTRFGMLDGFPLAGDWNGDGIDEVGVFWNGFWFIDVNGNRLWDRDDLVANSNNDDQAVVAVGRGQRTTSASQPENLSRGSPAAESANRMATHPRTTPLEDATEALNQQLIALESPPI
jgi:hypothetical protein